MTGSCVGGGLCDMSVVVVSTLLSVGRQCGQLSLPHRKCSGRGSV